MLEEAHMDVNAVDIHKHSALWYAVCSENTRAVQLLLQHGASNVMDNYDCTVLMTAGKGELVDIYTNIYTVISAAATQCLLIHLILTFNLIQRN